MYLDQAHSGAVELEKTFGKQHALLFVNRKVNTIRPQYGIRIYHSERGQIYETINGREFFNASTGHAVNIKLAA